MIQVSFDPRQADPKRGNEKKLNLNLIIEIRIA